MLIYIWNRDSKRWYMNPRAEVKYFQKYRLFKAFVYEKPTNIKGRRDDSNGCTLFWRASCPAWDLGKIFQKYSKIKRPHVLRGTQLNRTRILAPCALSDKATGCVSQPIKPQRKRHDEGRQVLVQQRSFSAGSHLPLICPLYSLFSSTATCLLFCFRRRSPPFLFPCNLLLKRRHVKQLGTLSFAAIQYTPKKRARFVWPCALAPLPVLFCLCEGKSW